MASYSLPVKSTVKKSVLRNYIRHADTHNRVQEEREMWRLRHLERQTKLESFHSKPRNTITRGRLLSDTLRDDDDYDDGREPHSTYWMRQLAKVEENDPDRWGHSGYKELYPEEFISTDEDEGRRRERSGEKKSRGTKRKSDHKRQKQSKKQRLSTSTSSGGSDNERQVKKTKHKKKRKHKNDTR